MNNKENKVSINARGLTVHALIEELLKLPNQGAEVKLVFAELRNGQYIEDLVPATALYFKGNEVVIL